MRGASTCAICRRILNSKTRDRRLQGGLSDDDPMKRVVRRCTQLFRKFSGIESCINQQTNNIWSVRIVLLFNPSETLGAYSRLQEVRVVGLETIGPRNYTSSRILFKIENLRHE